MKPGSTVRPGRAEDKHIDNCPTCAALAAGTPTPFDSPTPEGWVYATSDLAYARHYASKARGDLYLVRLIGDKERSTEDMFPTWRARKAKVLTVVEREVTLTHAQRRSLFKRWGGTDDEYDAMVAAVTRG